MILRLVMIAPLILLLLSAAVDIASAEVPGRVEPPSSRIAAGIAEDTDPLSSFRMGAALRLRAEFPLRLHGYNVEEVLARRNWLVSASYRFPIWPGQDRVHLDVLGDYPRVDYVRGQAGPTV